MKKPYAFRSEQTLENIREFTSAAIMSSGKNNVTNKLNLFISYILLTFLCRLSCKIAGSEGTADIMPHTEDGTGNGGHREGSEV